MSAAQVTPLPPPSLIERHMGELLIRSRARASLVDFASYIEIPGAPVEELAADFDFTEDVVFKPIESRIVTHHRVILAEIQRCMETADARLMIIAPPGSAKSTMADVVAPPWAMGKWPGYRILLTSYATRLARKHGRRALQIAKARRYSALWRERPAVRPDQAAANEWALTNGSEFMAAGILAGITGNRANGAICDDVIAGREEAESPTIRAKTMEAYRDDVESRLLPGGWVIFINTRWHQDDPCGQILPDDYDGRSGEVVCKDGRTWRVLNMPAKAERADDPVGRAPGEYLWPEWFPITHWQALEADPSPGGQRRWQGLYQGRPMSGAGDDFDRADAQWFELSAPAGAKDGRPKALTVYGASDFAVTDPEDDLKAAGRVDWTEHGVFGMDERGDLWILDWWSGQKETDTAIDAMLDFVPRYRPAKWWDEGGVIDKAIRPALRRRMRERSNERVGGRTTSYFVSVDVLPSIADKRAKCQSFAARYQARTIHFPSDRAWSHQVLDQLINLGAARHDDKADVCGLIGRGIDTMLEARKPPPERDKGPKPFTAKWIEYEPPKPGPRYR